MSSARPMHSALSYLAGYEYRDLDGIEHGMTVQMDALLVRMDKEFPVKFSLDEYVVTASYWRAADQAVNIYERFRDLYLIVDKVGKALSPTGTGDSEVLKKTISTVVGGDLQPLHSEAKRIATETGLTLPGNSADDIAHVLYKANRCALNHAGGIADRRPFNLHDEREVSLALKLMKNVAKRYLDHR